MVSFLLPTALSPETKEQIAGFDIIECADMQEAIEVASAHPTTRHGTIEIRPFPPE